MTAHKKSNFTYFCNQYFGNQCIRKGENFNLNTKSQSKRSESQKSAPGVTIFGEIYKKIISSGKFHNS